MDRYTSDCNRGMGFFSGSHGRQVLIRSHQPTVNHNHELILDILKLDEEVVYSKSNGLFIILPISPPSISLNEIPCNSGVQVTIHEGILIHKTMLRNRVFPLDSIS